MSGGVYLPGGGCWTAAGWLFELVLRILASAAGGEVEEELHGILRSGVGVLDVPAMAPERRQVLIGAITEDLLPRMADVPMRAEWVDRREVLRHVQGLVEAAARAGEQVGPNRGAG